MAVGRAIITTDAPGCRETVIPNRNGFLIVPRSVDALIVAMERFLKQPNLIREMAAQSRCLAEDRYDVHKVNAQIIEAMGIG